MFLPPEEVQDITQLPILVSERVVLPFVTEIKPIRITEAKHIDLLDDIALGDRFFGVICNRLINRNHPSGPIGLPHVNGTGCIAELTEYNRFKDDDATIKVKGLARYRIVEYVDAGKTYPVAEIKFFEEERFHDDARLKQWVERADKLEEVKQKACHAAQRVLTKIFRALGNDEYEAPLMNPPDAVAFSFLIARLFSFDQGDDMHILQSPCPIHRLEFAVEWLEEYEKGVEENIERKKFLKPFLHIKNNPDLG